ncbi:MAG: hypothetical protein RIB63_15695, partial [Fulvivirga sp.]
MKSSGIFTLRKIIILLLFLQNGAIAQFAKPDTIPFRIESGLMIVNTTINGFNECQMLFDTGSSTIIKTQDANRLKIRSKGAVDSFSLGKTQFYNVPILKEKFNESKKVKTFFSNKNGVLGSNLISLHNWIIDFKLSQLVIDPNVEIDSSWKEIDFTIDSFGRIWVEPVITTAKLFAMVDTGAAGGILLLSSFVETYQIPVSSKKMISFHDLNGKHKCTEYTSEALNFKLGNLQLNDIEIKFSCIHSVLG